MSSRLGQYRCLWLPPEAPAFNGSDGAGGDGTALDEVGDGLPGDAAGTAESGIADFASIQELVDLRRAETQDLRDFIGLQEFIVGRLWDLLSGLHFRDSSGCFSPWMPSLSPAPN